MAQLWLLHLLPAPAGAVWVLKARVLVLDVLQQLFALHAAGMSARRALEFLHVSKAAGTSMCKLAGEGGRQGEAGRRWHGSMS